MPLTAKQNRLSLVNAYRKAARGNPRLQLLRLTTERVRSLLPIRLSPVSRPFSASQTQFCGRHTHSGSLLVLRSSLSWRQPFTSAACDRQCHSGEK